MSKTMPASFLRTILFSTLLSVSFSEETEYYWREYKGTIPYDAIVGGHDANRENVYIGQAYIHGEGLMVVQIKAGVKEVRAPIKGVKHVNMYTKILCGHQEDFVWFSTNSSVLHVDMLDKIPVFGGHENGKGTIYVGRISYEGGTQIGKVNAFSVGGALFLWPDIHNNEVNTGAYEVLVYHKYQYSDHGVSTTPSLYGRKSI